MVTVVNPTHKDNIYSYWLFLLLGLFALRVAGQLIQLVWPMDLLPALESWQGSAIPYGWLLGIQLLLIGWVAVLAVRIRQGACTPNRRVGRVLLILGMAYFLVMLIRLVLGLTLFTEHPWLAKPIPAFFHLVLACMMFTIGHYHWRSAR